MAEKTIDILHEEVKQAGPEIIVVKFADSKIPIFKEVRNKDYIQYGEKNLYPEYLTYLYSKSAKHGAIINGKSNYVFGEGFENGDFVINRLGESLNDISKKCVLDIEIYGGCRMEIVYNALGRISEIYHVDYTTLRLAKDGGYFYKETWDPKNNDETEYIPCFNPKEPKGTQIYAYNEYRPMTRFYPLPSYISCNNFIETDIEISKYYLSAIKNGMLPSKMIQFFQGEPTEEKKAEIERRFNQKFAGSENAGRVLLVFNAANAQRPVEINDLSASELDKHFVELNKVTQQEIFSGHLVTSPMLFGIKTEGQLGGSTELNIAYSIFQNTYSKPKAKVFSKEITYLMSFSQYPGEYELMPTHPVGLQLDVKDVIQTLPKSFVYKTLGIPEEEWNQPAVDGSVPTAAPEMDTQKNNVPVNDNIKNLSAKQHQQVMRIVRQYAKGQLTALAAKALLRTGYGLTEQDINEILGIQQPAQMNAEKSIDEVVELFDSFGENKDDYEIVKSKKVCFSEEAAEEDEKIFIQEAFKTYDVTRTENRIIELIKKDSKVTNKVIADAIGQSELFVKGRIESLVKRGYIEESVVVIGIDEELVRTIPVEISAPPPIKGTTPPTQISIKYSYELKAELKAKGEPEIIETTRNFCIKLLKLNRLYTRAEIEKISTRLGYSVFERKGGWWGKSPECRHRWVSHIVVKKGGDK